MNLSSKLDQIHLHAKSNRWHRYFSIFLRIFLAWGFVTAGIVKVMGERFASGLSVNHPMGQYLQALYHTGFYYTFIGVLQVIAAILLLIPRTVLLGALLYLPIILNICVLSYAVRFEGSMLTSPLMVLACLYLICWNYDKVKYILPLTHLTAQQATEAPKSLDNAFPGKFFLGAAASVSVIALFNIYGFEIVPRNSSKDCNSQFVGTNRTKAGAQFCDCLHTQGLPLNNCIELYNKLPDDPIIKK